MRKSRTLRLSQTESLIELYSNDGLSNDYRCRFMKDMKNKLEAGRNISTKQRAWLDNLILEGLPTIDRDNDLVQKLRDALSTPGMNHRSSILSDFLGIASSGRKFSEKQESFMLALLEEANKVKIEGPYTPDDETIEKLRQCVKISKAYTHNYWITHPGTAKALEAVKAWLEDTDTFIDTWSVNKILSSMKGRLLELTTKPYVQPGDLIWYRNGGPQTVVPGMVTSPPEVSETGQIVYPILVDGNVINVTRGYIAKRRGRGV